MPLPVKLKEKVKGSVLIDVLKKAAKDMNLETITKTVVVGVELGSVKLEHETNIGILMPYLGGHLKNEVADIFEISPEKMYDHFSIHKPYNIFGPKFEDFNFKKYLSLVSKYLDEAKQPNN
jgi:hypothetical protein